MRCSLQVLCLTRPHWLIGCASTNPERGNGWLVACRAASPIGAEHLLRHMEALASAAETRVVASSTTTRSVPQVPRPLTCPDAHQAGFGAQLALVDGVVRESVEWPQPLEVTLRWQVLVDGGSDHRALVTLRSGDGHSWSREEPLVRNATNSPTSAWRAGEWAGATYQLALPPGIPPDRYGVGVSAYDAGAEARVGAAGSAGDLLGTRVHVGYGETAPPGVRPVVAELSISEAMAVVAGPLRLIGMNPLAEDVLSGESLPLVLYWIAEGPTDESYTLFAHLLGPERELVGQVDRIPGGGAAPTSSWAADQVIAEEIWLPVSPDADAGAYGIAVGFYDLAYGGRLLVDMGEGQILSQDRVVLPTQIAVTR